MIKVALIVIITSIGKTEMVPNVSITGFFKDLTACHKVMDNIKSTFKMEDFFDSQKVRYLPNS